MKQLSSKELFQISHHCVLKIYTTHKFLAKFVKKLLEISEEEQGDSIFGGGISNRKGKFGLHRDPQIPSHSATS